MPRLTLGVRPSRRAEEEHEQESVSVPYMSTACWSTQPATVWPCPRATTPCFCQSQCLAAPAVIELMLQQKTVPWYVLGRHIACSTATEKYTWGT